VFFDLFWREVDKVDKEFLGKYGKIIIDKDVISKLAGIAATECCGIVGMASSHVIADGIAGILGRESLSKGVDVIIKDDSIRIKVNIVVGYGINISVIARNVMDNVKYVVEKHVGTTVDYVDVNIQGVRVVD
jgi:uncharacterized alkaline shock family protein YloU